jgi:hypothetical protein
MRSQANERVDFTIKIAVVGKNNNQRSVDQFIYQYRNTAEYIDNQHVEKNQYTQNNVDLKDGYQYYIREMKYHSNHQDMYACVTGQFHYQATRSHGTNYLATKHMIRQFSKAGDLSEVQAIVIPIDLNMKSCLDDLKDCIKDILPYVQDNVMIAIVSTGSNNKTEEQVIDYYPSLFRYNIKYWHTNENNDENIAQRIFHAFTEKYYSIIHQLPVRNDFFKPQASNDDQRELINLIKEMTKNAYWNGKVKPGYGTQVTGGGFVPGGIADAAEKANSLNGDNYSIALEEIGGHYEWKYSYYFQALHRFFRNRADESNDFYGILAKLKGQSNNENAIRTITLELKQFAAEKMNLQVNQSSSTLIMNNSTREI